MERMNMKVVEVCHKVKEDTGEGEKSKSIYRIPEKMCERAKEG